MSAAATPLKTAPAVLRSPRDRIRHAVMFEVIALVLVAPLGGLIFGVEVAEFGVVAVVSTTIAMGWNYIFNLGFDHGLLALGKALAKTPMMRVVHAITFEASLLALLVPFIAWYLAVPLWDAFVMDISLTGFYLCYAFVFNWGYDLAFPLPQTR